MSSLRIHPIIIKLFSNYLHPIGEYYETSNLDFNPNKVWFGTWELEEDGTVLVSKSEEANSKFNVSVGTILGEEEHSLTSNENAAHTHTINLIQNGVAGGGNLFAVNPNSIIVTNTGSGGNFGNTSSSGNGKAHNNIQPSKVVNRWHRTA